MSNLRGLYKIIVVFDNIKSHDKYYCAGYPDGYLSSNHGEAYRCSKDEAERLVPRIKRSWSAVIDVKFECLDSRTGF